MLASDVFAMLFRQKAWANEALFREVRAIDGAAHAEAEHLATRLLNHVYTVDQIFAAHLTRRMHSFTATNTVDTPTLDTLREGVAALDQWYVDYAGNIAANDANEAIEFTFTDGKAARMSRIEMLLHLITHGSYHRGAVGRIVAQTGGPPIPDAVTTYLHQSEPERRQRSV